MLNFIFVLIFATKIYAIEIPICHNVLVTGVVNDAISNSQLLNFSYNLVTEKYVDEPHHDNCNIVTITYFKSSVGADRTTAQFVYDYGRYVVDRFIPGESFCLPDSEWHFLLSFSGANEIYMSTFSLFMKNLSIFDGISGEFMTEKNQFQLEQDSCYSENTGIECYQVATCQDFDYLDLENDDSEQFEETCSNFESNVTLNITYCSDLTISHEVTNYTILYSLSEEELTTEVITSLNATEYSFGPLSHVNTCPKNSTTCTIPLPKNDFQFEMFLFHKDDMIVGEIAKRNGILLRDDNVPFTKEDPCWTLQENLPFHEKSGCIAKYSYTFCCTNFKKAKRLPSTPGILASTAEKFDGQTSFDITVDVTGMTTTNPGKSDARCFSPSVVIMILAFVIAFMNM